MENNKMNQLLIAGGIFLAILITGVVAFTPKNRSDVLGTSINRPQGMVQLVPVREIPGAIIAPQQ